MHNAALRAVGLVEWRYQLLPVPPELFAETVRALPGAGFRGANVTIPHKEAALALATEATSRARAVGAANTLVFGERGEIAADNTDAPAVIAALPTPAAGKRALVLGAGGSARAAVWALLDAGAAEVFVWNRTVQRARQLAAELGGTPVALVPETDFLVNCTSIGMESDQDALKSLPITADSLRGYECVIDLVYTDTETPLIRAARQHGVPAVDGLTILVGQGALSFELFTGRRAPIQAMRSAVRGP
jgi:shikimate dehydrogenase